MNAVFTGQLTHADRLNEAVLSKLRAKLERQRLAVAETEAHIQAILEIVALRAATPDARKTDPAAKK